MSGLDRKYSWNEWIHHFILPNYLKWQLQLCKTLYFKILTMIYINLMPYIYFIMIQNMTLGNKYEFEII